MLLVLRSQTCGNAAPSQPCLCCLCLGFLHYQQRLVSLHVFLFFNGLWLDMWLVSAESSNSPNIHQSIETIEFGINQTPLSRELSSFYTGDSNNDQTRGSDVDIIHPPPSLPSHHPCDSFSFPPPPPPGLRRPGPRRKLSISLLLC